MRLAVNDLKSSVYRSHFCTSLAGTIFSGLLTSDRHDLFSVAVSATGAGGCYKLITTAYAGIQACQQWQVWKLFRLQTSLVVASILQLLN